MTLVNTSNLNIRSMFEDKEWQDLQTCMEHANLQIKNEQRSWKAIVSDNMPTIGKLVVCTAITHVALNSLLSMSLVTLPLVGVLLIYTTFKLGSLNKEAGDTLLKTQKVFMNIFSKYGSKETSFPEGLSLQEQVSLQKAFHQKRKEVDAFIRCFADLKTQKVFMNIFSKYGSKETSFPEGPSLQEQVSQQEAFRQKRKEVDDFIRRFTDSTEKFSPLKAAEVIDSFIIKHGNDKGLGSLVKIAFKQVIKDYRRVDKIRSYDSALNIGKYCILSTAQSMDGLFSHFSFLASKSSLIVSMLLTAVFFVRPAVHICRNHWNDQEIGKNTFDEALPELNILLEIPEENRAYS